MNDVAPSPVASSASHDSGGAGVAKMKPQPPLTPSPTTATAAASASPSDAKALNGERSKSPKLNKSSSAASNGSSSQQQQAGTPSLTKAASASTSSSSDHNFASEKRQAEASSRLQETREEAEEAADAVAAMSSAGPDATTPLMSSPPPADLMPMSEMSAAEKRRKLLPSLTAKAAEDEVEVDPAAEGSPHSRRLSSSASFLPLLFERAAPAWWNPHFDSPILEAQYWKSTLPRTTRRFQFGLTYVFILSFLLAVYFPLMKTKNWPVFLGESCYDNGTLVRICRSRP